jgi:hypothetical protein
MPKPNDLANGHQKPSYSGTRVSPSVCLSVRRLLSERAQCKEKCEHAWTVVGQVPSCASPVRNQWIGDFQIWGFARSDRQPATNCNNYPQVTGY